MRLVALSVAALGASALDMAAPGDVAGDIAGVEQYTADHTPYTAPAVVPDAFGVTVVTCANPTGGVCDCPGDTKAVGGGTEGVRT